MLNWRERAENYMNQRGVYLDNYGTVPHRNVTPRQLRRLQKKDISQKARASKRPNETEKQRVIRYRKFLKRRS